VRRPELDGGKGNPPLGFTAICPDHAVHPARKIALQKAKIIQKNSMIFEHRVNISASHEVPRLRSEMLDSPLCRVVFSVGHFNCHSMRSYISPFFAHVFAYLILSRMNRTFCA
jgi:hypothetical protein